MTQSDMFDNTSAKAASSVENQCPVASSTVPSHSYRRKEYGPRHSNQPHPVLVHQPASRTADPERLIRDTDAVSPSSRMG